MKQPLLNRLLSDRLTNIFVGETIINTSILSIALLAEFKGWNDTLHLNPFGVLILGAYLILGVCVFASYLRASVSQSQKLASNKTSTKATLFYEPNQNKIRR